MDWERLFKALLLTLLIFLVICVLVIIAIWGVNKYGLLGILLMFIPVFFGVLTWVIYDNLK